MQKLDIGDMFSLGSFLLDSINILKGAKNAPAGQRLSTLSSVVSDVFSKFQGGGQYAKWGGIGHTDEAILAELNGLIGAKKALKVAKVFKALGNDIQRKDLRLAIGNILLAPISDEVQKEVDKEAAEETESPVHNSMSEIRRIKFLTMLADIVDLSTEGGGVAGAVALLQGEGIVRSSTLHERAQALLDELINNRINELIKLLKEHNDQLEAKYPPKPNHPSLLRWLLQRLLSNLSGAYVPPLNEVWRFWIIGRVLRAIGWCFIAPVRYFWPKKVTPYERKAPYISEDTSEGDRDV